ncbi:MAG: FTR1 family protein [Alphaproteobacteria bacterium]|nr:FTR1 family protein [Alphaproteobacteria bacterium]
MLAVAVIVFREVLEAALIVSVVLAATVGVPRRGGTVALGIAAGIAGAALVAAFTGEIAAAVAGMGQELFDAAILFTAVGMLGWHNVWMQRHGRELAASASQVGNAVRSGARPLYALGLVVGLAVLREGSEVVLFVYGIAAAAGTSALAQLGGGLFGLACGVAVGVGLYWGLLRIPMRHLFTVTSWLILLLAAGMASQGAAFLNQVGLLPSAGGVLWDSSFLLSDQSVLGKTLHALIGYVSHPLGIQLVFYVGTIAIIGALMQLNGRDAVTLTPLKPAE